MDALTVQINEAYEREHAAAKPALTADELPLSYEAVTDEWLTDILCRDVAGAKVVSHRLDVTDDGTNNRRRIFLEYNAEGQAAGLPSSVFCKATHGLANRQMLGHSGGILCETTFFNVARPLLDIEAPKAYYAKYDPVSFNSFVMLRDLGEEMNFCSEATPVDLDFARSQVELLAALHGRFYDAPELDGALSALPTWHRRFSNLAGFHLEESCDRGFVAAENVIPASLFARKDEVWPATMDALEQQKDLPLALCHGDVHLKNWYIRHDGRTGLGDWGVAHRGHFSRDLVYTISTALTVENRRAWERELVELYLDRLAAAGADAPDFDAAWLEYRKALMTAFAFWTLTLNPTEDYPDMQPRQTAITFIERMAHALDDLDVLDAVKQDA